MSQVKITTLMNIDGSKQATANDVIDGTAKTKLFSPFSLSMLAGVDAATLRGSLVAASSGVNGDITSLTGLTTPLSVGQGGSGKTTEFRKGFIDGLRLVYTSRTTFTVAAGSAYISSLGKIVELAADKVVTPTLAASTMYHAYMFENAGVADVELVTTVPVRYYGSAYQKTGDTSRRYIGSLLTNSSSQLFGFNHSIITGRMDYTEGTPGVAPFVLWTAFATTTPTLVGALSYALAPKETALSIIGVAAGIATIRTSTPDQLTGPTAGGSNWRAGGGIGGTVSADVPLEIPLSRTAGTQGQFYVWCPVGSSTYYAIGYNFER